MAQSPSLDVENASPINPLEQLCQAHGIVAEFWDIWGNRHTPSKDVQRAILTSLGWDVSTPEGERESFRAYLRNFWNATIPHTVVVPHGQPLRVPIRIPTHQRKALFRAELVCEDGTRQSAELPVAHWAVSAQAELGEKFEERLGTWPFVAPLGYHQLLLHIQDQDSTKTAQAHLIVGPDRAWVPETLEQGGRAAGVAVSLYGVRSLRNWGCGDFSDLLELIDWVAEDLEGSFLGLNPLHAIDNRQPYNISPYLPNSTFWRNPLYLDVESVPEFQESETARQWFQSAEIQAQIQALRESELVEYEKVWALKQKALRIAFTHFLQKQQTGADPDRLAAYHQFVAEGGDRLRRFALYCALWEYLHEKNPQLWIWPDWPEEYQRPDSDAVEEFARNHEDQIHYFMYLQWLIDEQLRLVQAKAKQRGLPIGLYHDLALAVDRCGADLWAYRDFFVSGCRVGSPPDGFAPQGQDWAFPPPNSQRHFQSGYRLFIDAIRATSRYGGALRIDHVMRLFRLYWIPDGYPASQGAYVLDRSEDLLRILALESHRGKFLIVGEDLGTVEHRMREALDRFGILSYKVLYFEQCHGRMRKPQEYARQALVTSTTHDLPTLAGFWIHQDIEARKAAGLLNEEAYQRQLAERRRDRQLILEALHELELLPSWFPRKAEEVAELTGELHNAIIGFLMKTPCMLMVLNQEDLTKEIHQQNLPASTWQYPNWRRKMRFSVEQLRRLREPQDFAAMFRNWLNLTGRSLKQLRSTA
ncbi:MAG: 4-alpha-glucanotransferase [Bryobacteraceae bacterium]|nr:4-alpha-glucanotransferase [Bryobacteraceae bacterium]MDW8378923.1 4-alpha-glucanotransferase [Bryobacterales bacterium]